MQTVLAQGSQVEWGVRDEAREAGQAAMALLVEGLDAHADGQGALTGMVQAFVQAGALRSLLSWLLGSPSLLAALAACSYRHGNGFTKFELLTHRGYKVRLHVWMPGVQAEENIHDHRWAFCSMILAGELHSELFADDPDGEVRCSEYAYVARRDGQMAHQEPRGEARLRSVARQSRGPGEVYAMMPEVLHRICVDGRSLIATLMIAEPPLAGGSRLLVESTRSVGPDVSAAPLDPAFAADTLCVLLAHLPECF